MYNGKELNDVPALEFRMRDKLFIVYKARMQNDDHKVDSAERK